MELERLDGGVFHVTAWHTLHQISLVQQSQFEDAVHGIQDTFPVILLPEVLDETITHFCKCWHCRIRATQSGWVRRDHVGPARSGTSSAVKMPSGVTVSTSSSRRDSSFSMASVRYALCCS